MARQPTLARIDRRAAVLAAALVIGAIGLPFRPVAADSVQDKQRQADQLAERIDRLESHAEQLAEEYNQSLLDVQAAEADVTSAKARLAEHELGLASLRAQMAQFALKSYVYADEGGGVATLLDAATLSGASAGRAGYARLAMGASTDLVDSLRAQLEDAARLRAQVESKETRQRQLANAVARKQAAVDKATTASQAALQQVKGDLVQLVAEAEQRKVEAAAAAQQAAIKRQQDAAAAAASRAGPAAAGAPARESPVAARGGGGAPPPPAPAKPVFAPPPPSAGAAGAVAAARSQVGNRYVAFKSNPADGFDCSGLTMWAWAQAGVSLPHQSGQQFASLPHVPIDQLQPGDLVFMGSPIHHVGLYVGGGMMVDAASERLGVRLAPIHSMVGAARPG